MPSTTATVQPRQRARHGRGDDAVLDLVGRMPAANSYELDFAKALITGEKLGQSGVTDLLVVSLSANDIQGHQFGPDSEFEEQMILGLDKDLDGFAGWLDQTVGLQNVWMALTADHGIPPIPADAAQLGIDSAVVDLDKLYPKVDEALNARFSPGKKVEYLLPKPTAVHYARSASVRESKD